MRIAGTFALILVLCLPVGVVADRAGTASKKTKLLNVRVAYLRTSVDLEESEDGTGKLTTSWFTPVGDRQEMADGNISLYLSKTSVVYHLDEEAKTARRFDSKKMASSITPARQKQLEAGFKQLLGKFPQQNVRKETFLGRTCEVSQVSMKIPEKTLQITKWKAQVGGHSVTLRSLTKTYKGGALVGVNLEEAVHIQAVPTSPANLLQVPADYTVTEATFDIETLLKFSEQYLRPDKKPR